MKIGAMLLSLFAAGRWDDFRPLLLPLLLGAVGVYLLLPRPRRVPPLIGAVLAALGLVLGGWTLIHTGQAPVETVLFCAFAGIAVVAAGMVLAQRKPAHAALSFALVVLSTCGLFLLQGAPFLMAATIIIYAGAIIVTFLFVLMLAQQEGPSDADDRAREPLLATIAGFVLLGALTYVVRTNYDDRGLDTLSQRVSAATGKTTAEEIRQTLGEREGLVEMQQVIDRLPRPEDRQELKARVRNVEIDWFEEPAKLRDDLHDLGRAVARVRSRFGSLPPPAHQDRSPFSVPDSHSGENVAPLGRTLFTDYLLAIEISGALLLVATIGAIIITGRRGEGRS